MTEPPSHRAANADATELAAAESAFAAQSARAGMRQAFLANFADDGVFVRGDWTASRAWLSARPDPPVLLEWKPVHTEVAGSGELGLSTGPWRLTRRDDAKAAPSFGQFVSVWRREADGSWKVIVDIGTSNPRATFWNFPLEAMPSGDAGKKPAETVSEAEARFEAMTRSAGPAAAYNQFASLRLRCYREGMVPMVGRGIAVSAVLGEEPAQAWKVVHADTSRSGDLGYTRGAVNSAAQPAKALGHFLRVWRAEEGEWRIVMDVVQAP
jgi:ketosteroid isomerase-like protein